MMGIAPKSLPFNVGFEQDIDNVPAPVTGSEAAGEVWDSSMQDTAVMAWARQSAMDDLDNGSEVFSPQDLNKKFPKMPRPFTRPLNLAQADFIAEQQEKEGRRQQLINQGPSGFMYGSLNFMAGLVPHALDPLELGAGYLVGAGIGVTAAGTRIGTHLGIRATTATGIAARMGLESIPTTVGSTALQTFGRTSLEGIAGNLAIEAAIIGPAAARDMREYTAETLFMSTIGGAVGFAGAHYGIPKVLGFALKRGKKAYSTVFKSAAAQMDEGISARVTPIIQDLIDETSKTPNPDLGIMVDGKTSYSFESKPDPSGNKIYVSFETPSNKDVGKIQSAHIGDDFGDHVYATDSQFVANGASSRKLFDVPGNYHEVDVSKVKLADLNSKLGDNPELSRAFTDFMDQNKIGGIELSAKKTGLQIFDEIRQKVADGKISEATFLKYKDAFESRGFDGLTHDLSKWADFDHSRANTYVIFDPKKLKKTRTIKGNQDVVHKVGQSDLQKMANDQLDNKNKMGYSQEIADAVKDHELNPYKDVDINSVKTTVREHVDSLEASKINESQALELKEFKKFEVRADTENKAIEFAFNCFGGKRGSL